MDPEITAGDESLPWDTPAEPPRPDWRSRFRDERGNPLPPDYVRIDVTTGEIVRREKPSH
jgi:hypothetical protein